jgi:hypothetical protein
MRPRDRTGKPPPGRSSPWESVPERLPLK